MTCPRPSTRRPQAIDAEVTRLVTEQCERTQVLLKDHDAALETLAQQLVKQETVSGGAVKEALKRSTGPGPITGGAGIAEGGRDAN
jgi:ATP-dependent Zn protease